MPRAYRIGVLESGARGALAALLWLGALSAGVCATSINATNRHAYGANLGWLDARGDTNNGAVIGEFVCSGYLYGANVGWIHLGNNAPVNGIQYQNNSASDYGVNHDGQGNLRGFGYAANIGWLNFETNGAPKVDLKSGKLSGWIYAANCGWISLSNAWAVVQTDTIPGGADANGNGLPDAWERLYFGALGVNPNADPDGDGASNKQEYLAGTNPTNATDNLSITAFATGAGGTNDTLTWRTVATRCYRVLQGTNLLSPVWLDSGLGLIAPAGATTTRVINGPSAAEKYYRIEAVRPLAP